jgi:hypothetical protein
MRLMEYFLMRKKDSNMMLIEKVVSLVVSVEMVVLISEDFEDKV